VSAGRASGQGLGRLGETAAAQELRRAGLEILEVRFRSRLGEIDLIAKDGETIVFVEVKARAGVGYGRPAEAITRAKRERIARVAQVYLTRRALHDRACRFDVVEVLRRGTTTEIRHIRDAFRLWRTG